MVRVATNSQIKTNGETGRQIKRLFIARAITASLLLLIVLYFFFSPLPGVHRGILVTTVLFQTALLLFQWRLTNTHLSHGVQIGFQLLGDMFVVSVLIFVTGGLASPFALLFGLLIIAAGTQAQAMLALTVALAASACYLGSIYLAAWDMQHMLTINESLAALMQVSALLLAGGVMAYMARRQQKLMTVGSQAVRLHRNLKALHSQVMDAMHDGILVLDESCYISDANHAACSALAEGGEIRGQSLSAVMRLPESLRCFFKDNSQSICRCEYNWQERALLLMATRMPEGDAQAKWLLSMVDITDFRHLKRKLADQEKLAAMGRMAAMVAHEIRNPLQSIGQSVEILAKGQNIQQQEVGNIMLEEVQRLNHLVSDMLNYAQPLYPKPKLVVISDVLHAAIRQVDIHADMNIHLDCADAEFEMDAGHFRLAIDNLLRNAIQASPVTGSIRVRFAVENDEQWNLEVIDMGGGMNEAVKAHVFEPFVSNKSDGVGLGLATVWQVCQANGWKVAVNDVGEQGDRKGARFTLTGPLCVAHSKPVGG